MTGELYIYCAVGHRIILNDFEERGSRAEGPTIVRKLARNPFIICLSISFPCWPVTFEYAIHNQSRNHQT